MTQKRSRRTGASSPAWRPSRLARQRRLVEATDYGYPVKVPSAVFGLNNWGQYAESFLRLNAESLNALDMRAELSGNSSGTVLNLIPGGRAGAAPLRSGISGQVVGGLLVRPRFGWPGVGQILHQTGWHASPQFLNLSLVPGSAREVPPWVLAGPVLARLASLMHSMYPGFRESEEILTKPRGHILWKAYLSESLSRGLWHRVPCRFPDLAVDPLLRRYMRWTLERLNRSLLMSSGNDHVALGLAALAMQMMEMLPDVTPLMPRRNDLDIRMKANRVLGEALRQGIEAMAWIVDERGLGGGSERDGLAWALRLDRLWESYVESFYRRETERTGGEVRVGRLGQTVFPLEWSDPMHRTLGSLVPDLVIRRGDSIHIVDAKYKAHLAEVDEMGWKQVEEEGREQHRADLHQVLAYASLYEASEITATLVYPLRLSTFISLRERQRDRSFAELLQGGRRVRLELRGLPFGGPASMSLVPS